MRLDAIPTIDLPADPCLGNHNLITHYSVRHTRNLEAHGVTVIFGTICGKTVIAYDSESRLGFHRE